jgi:hypothetical protein
MDVNNTKQYRLNFYSVPRETSKILRDTVQQFRKSPSLIDEWRALDIWFEHHYGAYRVDETPFWHFPNKERYVEFCLKWM